MDWITLALFAIILFAPFINKIRRIRIGDFEAEISREEVARVRKSVGAAIQTDSPNDFDLGSYSAILELVATDAQLGLAKLRIEIERELNGLMDSIAPDERGERPMGLMRLATELVNRGGIDQEVYGALRDIIPLANRAVHGENVEVSDAEDLARLGVSVLQIIRENTLGQLRSDPGRVTITERERDDYLHRRKYRVKTIVLFRPDHTKMST